MYAFEFERPSTVAEAVAALGAEEAQALAGGEFDGREAYRIGLVSELVPAPEVQPRAMELAQEIAQQAPLAVVESRASACAFLAGGESNAVAELPAQLARLAQSEDFAEGVNSFVERRPARFRGR